MNKDNVRKLKAILEKAGEIDPGELKKEAAAFLKTIDSNDLIQAEQALVDEGLPVEELRHLCPAHMQILNEEQGDLKARLDGSHPLHILMTEHEEIMKFLAVLEEVNGNIQKAESLEKVSSGDIAKLKHIVEHLIGAENHHKREEDVLFPAIEKRGIYGPTKIMRLEHDQFRLHEKQLEKIINSSVDDFQKFKKNVDKLAKFIVFNLRDHIFKENTILYPASLDVIKSSVDWKKIRQQFDKIGYCCFSPKLESNVAAELDLRPMPPFERHIKIFEVWEKLEKGAVMRIINDHDPKPLHYQFEAELPNTYIWEYVENGPKDWVVNITKK